MHQVCYSRFLNDFVELCHFSALFCLLDGILNSKNGASLSPFADPVVLYYLHEAFHAFEKLLCKKGRLVLIVWSMLIQKLQDNYPHISFSMRLALEHKSSVCILELKLVSLPWLDIYHLFDCKNAMWFDVHSLQLFQVNCQIAVLVLNKRCIFSLTSLVHSQVKLNTLTPGWLCLIIH